MDNFHLRGVGVNKRTGFSFVGRRPWTIVLTSRKAYRFGSDKHQALAGAFRTA